MVQKIIIVVMLELLHERQYLQMKLNTGGYVNELTDEVILLLVPLLDQKMDGVKVLIGVAMYETMKSIMKQLMSIRGFVGE